MERTIVYKADNFINGMEVSSGYFLTFHQAQASLNFQNETDHADGDYGMITEFDVATEDIGQGGIDDTETMALLLDRAEEPNYYYFI
jgi:hypothetical protein